MGWRGVTIALALGAQFIWPQVPSWVAACTNFWRPPPDEVARG